MSLLVACTPVATPKSLPISYQLDSAGIAVVDRGKRVDFGRTDHSTISAMTKLIGTGPVQDLRCDDLRRVDWADGTSLYFAINAFQEWSFRGWRNRERSAGSVCA